MGNKGGADLYPPLSLSCLSIRPYSLSPPLHFSSSCLHHSTRLSPSLPLSSTCLSLHLSVSPPVCLSGALYSRKLNLEGEEVSLQVQDTPCVALQVTHTHTYASTHVLTHSNSHKLLIIFYYFYYLSFIVPCIYCVGASF